MAKRTQPHKSMGPKIRKVDEIIVHAVQCDTWWSNYALSELFLLKLTAGPSSSIGSSSSSDRKRDRKRRTMAADAAIAAAQGLPPGINVSQMTRDERRALGLSLPISVADIINLPMDEFNDLLSKHELTEEQLTLCRDIRRRGKNKVNIQFVISWLRVKIFMLLEFFKTI